MRVLINGYVGKKITGIGRTLIETIQHLPLQPNDHIVITTNYDNHEIIALESEEITIIKIPVPKKNVLFNIIFNLIFFPFLSLFKKIDIVYIPNFIPLFIKFKPTIVVIHDLIEFNIKNKFSKLRTLYRKLIVPTLVKRSDHIITVSNYSKSDIIRFFKMNESKISVIYNSVFEARGDRINSFDGKKKYILYVGTIDFPGKGVHSLISGYEEFLNNYKVEDLELHLVGMNGKDFQLIDRLIESSKYKDRIKKLGYVNQEELENEYAGAFIFSFLSYYEGFGLPIIEAMKYQIPCLISNRSCLPEIGGDAVVIVDPDDKDAVANGINKIYFDHEFRDELNGRMKRNLTRFSWVETSQKTYEILRSYS